MLLRNREYMHKTCLSITYANQCSALATPPPRGTRIALCVCERRKGNENQDERKSRICKKEVSMLSMPGFTTSLIETATRMPRSEVGWCARTGSTESHATQNF